MIFLLEAGIDPCSPDISSKLAGPGFGATAVYTVVSESNFHLQLEFEYDAFGPLIQQDSATKQVLGAAQCFDVVFSTDTSPYRFTGKPVSTTTGLYYEYQRWYDPSIGRFISQDPLPGRRSAPQSLNPYVYVVNQPTLLTDPTGADATWDAVCGGDRCGGWDSTYGSVSSITVSLNDVEVSSIDVSEIPTSFEIGTTQFSDTSVTSTFTFDETPGYTQAERLMNLRNGIASHNSLIEDAVQQYPDAVRNTGPGQERIEGAKTYRIPDFRDLGEAKSGEVIQRTGNLRDFIVNADQTGGQVTLYVRPWADMSSIQTDIQRGLVDVRFVWPQQVIPLK